MKAEVNEWDLEKARRGWLNDGQSTYRDNGKPVHPSWFRSSKPTSAESLASILTKPMAIKGASLY